MTAASAPDEGRICWLKVTHNKRTRMIEWRTNDGTFKQMDEKVKKMFGLTDRIRLVYSYHEPTTSSSIVMSTDEELATALHFMVGDILSVDMVVEKKKRKSVIFRAYRSAQPKARAFLTRLQANARNNAVRVAHIIMLRCTQVFTWLFYNHQQQVQQPQQQQQQQPASASASASTSASAPPPYPRVQARRPCRFGFSHKLALFLLFLVLAVVIAKRSEWRGFRHASQYYHSFHHNHNHNHHHNFGGNHVTILAATYGGKDVTLQAREYYNKVGSVKASNELFGDPLPGSRKFLHVVYQYYSHNGLEVYSQSFPEMNVLINFNKQKDTCAFPEEAIVDGSSVKILGAMYDEASATCPTRRLAATGRFSYMGYKDAVINRNHFGSISANGIFTVVYVKDNVLRTFVGREGTHVVW